MSEHAEGQPFQLDVEGVSQELRIRPEIYFKIVASFAQTLVAKMQQLEEALKINSEEQMRVLLHEIKGTAGNLRLKGISAAESVMHDAVKAKVPQATLVPMYEALRKEVEWLQKLVKEKSGA